MKYILLSLILLIALGASGQDSLKPYTRYFGNYTTIDGRRFTIGRTDKNLFLMDYNASRCYRLMRAGTDAFKVDDTTDSLTLDNASGFAWWHNGRKQPLREEVKVVTEDFVLKKKGEKLGGTLWKPLNKTKDFPVVILVHGSGYETRYGMRYLPYFFTSRGYGVVTFDKRGCGVSTGKFEPWFAGIHALADDVLQITEYIRGRKELQVSKLGLMGISNGAWVIINAAARSQQVDFLVPVVGGFIPVYQQELYRLHQVGMAAALPAAELAEMDQTMAALYSEQIFGESNAVQGAEKVSVFLKTAAGKKWLELTPLAAMQQLPAATLYQIGKAAWTNELSYNPAADLQQVKCPVYAILGEKDQISPTDTIMKIIDSLPQPAPTVKAVRIPRAIHFMEEEGTKRIPGLYLKTLAGIISDNK